MGALSSSSFSTSDSPDPSKSNNSPPPYCTSSTDAASESPLFVRVKLSPGRAGTGGTALSSPAASKDRSVVKFGVDLDWKPVGIGFPLLLGGMSLCWSLGARAEPHALTCLKARMT